jgi:hypothetical protein
MSWIGVDLDGTLSHHEGWVNASHIGEPVPAMVERVKAWLAEGKTVKIFTARVGPQKDINDAVRAREAIDRWCEEHLGQKLDITATKDFAMVELWDDRAETVIPNTGASLREVAARVVRFMAHGEGDSETIIKDIESLTK